MLISLYFGDFKLVLKVNSEPVLVMYSYSASKLSTNLTHGNKPGKKQYNKLKVKSVLNQKIELGLKSVIVHNNLD